MAAPLWFEYKTPPSVPALPLLTASNGRLAASRSRSAMITAPPSVEPAPESIAEPVVEEAKAEAVEAAEVVAADADGAETNFGPNENVEIVADPVEGKDDEPVEPEAAELTIVAGPSVPEVVEAVVEPVVEPVADVAAGEAEAKDVMPL